MDRMNGPPSAPPAPASSDGAARELAERVRGVRDRVRAEVARVVVGLGAVTDRLLVALLAGGHVLLEGVPGVAKTTLSKAFARTLGCDYHRIQFTPDLLPGDVTGTSVLDRKSGEFVVRPGPIFAQVLLADEVNRAPAKTQSALLEAMQERQVTIEGTTLPLPEPFVVLATQNPVEQEGVYRLPEAQLDRFLLRVPVGYPGTEPEVEMLRLHSRPTPEPERVLSPAEILELQAQLPLVFATESLLRYIVALAEASREHPDVALGASPRASLSLLKSARASALLGGRPYVTHEDVQAVALDVLGHRLILRPEAEIEGRDVAGVVAELLAGVPVAENQF
jgi:MoxR-like ATPase